MAVSGPTLKQGIVIVTCGAGLAFFGCLGFLTFLDGPARLLEFAFIALIFSAFAGVVVGLLFAVFAFLRWIWRSSNGEPPSQPPAGPPEPPKPPKLDRFA